MLSKDLSLSYLTNYNLTQEDTKSFYRHFHNDYEVFVFIKGEIEYIVEDKVYSLEPYQLLILKPKQYHFAVIKNKAVYSRMIINFTIEDELTEKLLEPDFLDLNLYPETLSLLKFILRNQAGFSKKDFTQLILNTIKSFLIIHNNLETKELPSHYMTLNPFIRKALLYIDENIQSKITLNDLAAELNINPYYFSRIFKQALGESPISYVRKKQLIRAQELIENGEYPTQVFYKFGFSDYSSFYRAYKAFFKKSPSED